MGWLAMLCCFYIYPCYYHFHLVPCLFACPSCAYLLVIYSIYGELVLNMFLSVYHISQVYFLCFLALKA